MYKWRNTKFRWKFLKKYMQHPHKYTYKLKIENGYLILKSIWKNFREQFAYLWEHTSKANQEAYLQDLKEELEEDTPNLEKKSEEFILNYFLDKVKNKEQQNYVLQVFKENYYQGGTK